MNRELIELQRGCKATCVVIPDENHKELGQALIMDAKIKDEYIFSNSLNKPIFKEKIDKVFNTESLTYFIVRGIDELTEDMQNRYIGLVKDREFNGYSLPDNVIIIFTVKEKEKIKKISKELYHFCVVAF